MTVPGDSPVEPLGLVVGGDAVSLVVGLSATVPLGFVVGLAGVGEVVLETCFAVPLERVLGALELVFLEGFVLPVLPLGAVLGAPEAVCVGLTEAL